MLRSSLVSPKFIFSQETITEEELAGFGLAYGDILTVDDHTVVSRALADADRVTIVTYGDSGHEPAQKGFVGPGMLDIQVDGDIFAAPNGAAVPLRLSAGIRRRSRLFQRCS